MCFISLCNYFGVNSVFLQFAVIITIIISNTMCRNIIIINCPFALVVNSKKYVKPGNYKGFQKNNAIFIMELLLSILFPYSFERKQQALHLT